MGKKSNAAKASVAAAFIAAGGTVAVGAHGATSSDNPQAEVSSYFGGLGLNDDFQHYIKANTGFESFLKYWKQSPGDATFTVIKFSGLNQVAPPPGFSDDGGGDK